MKFEANVGGWDRAIRIIAGIVLILLGIFGIWGGVIAILGYIIGALLFLTGLFNFCLAYLPFGFSSRKPKSSGTPTPSA
jgi:amino acid transporter